MKPLKPILLFAFLCFALGLQAQDVELIDTNQYEHASYKTMVDSCLKNVNLDAVPYGILLEKAFEGTRDFSCCIHCNLLY